MSSGWNSLKRKMTLGIACTMLLGVTGCTWEESSTESVNNVQDLINAESEQTSEISEAETSAVVANSDTTETSSSDQEDSQIALSVNGAALEVSWEDNETVQELKSLLENGNIIVDTQQHGGFEQVGSLPDDFVRNDVQMTTTPGDIVLYSGNSIVLFYGSNSWAYTKLGHINNKSQEELAELLGGASAEVVLSLT